MKIEKESIEISNLDFLLDYTGFDMYFKAEENGTTIVRGMFYGSEDLSWTEYEYRFDKNGNYLDSIELDSHR